MVSYQGSEWWAEQGSLLPSGTAQPSYSEEANSSEGQFGHPCFGMAPIDSMPSGLASCVLPVELHGGPGSRKAEVSV